jgi:choline-sulfatase
MKKTLSRREFLKKTGMGTIGLGLGGALLAGLHGHAHALTEKEKKYKDYNIVFVSFDALQAAHVHSLGYPRDITPAIDAVAGRGFSFSRAMSVASWTVPASMSWFTGVYPSEHRLTNKFAVYEPPVKKLSNLKELSPGLVTLAEVLKKNGYSTGGFTGNAGVNGVFGYSQGFDAYYFEKGRFGGMDQSIPKALEWLSANKDKKFFLFLHGYDIHGQHVPAGGFDYRFVDKGYDGKFTGSAAEQETLREEGLAKGELKLRDEDVRFWRAIYDEKINRTDSEFKVFLEGFEKLGLADKTIFVLTSDHGTELCEHKRFDHGFSLYDELIHVPLVIKLPNVSAGRVIKDQVSSIDVMPTILDLLDVQADDSIRKQLRGSSLTPAFKGDSVAKDVFSETDYRLYTYKRALITKDGWKYIFTLENKKRELYNLQDDPGETVNQAEKMQRRAYELEQRLFAHFKSIGSDLTARRWETGLNPVYDSQAKG